METYGFENRVLSILKAHLAFSDYRNSDAKKPYQTLENWVINYQQFASTLSFKQDFNQ